MLDSDLDGLCLERGLWNEKLVLENAIDNLGNVVHLKPELTM